MNDTRTSYVTSPAARATTSRRSVLAHADALLLAMVVLLYSLTRLVGLERFPLYFFCDEAIQPVLARELLDRGLRDEFGTLLPTYFYNADKWSLGLSVYVQAVSVALFGTSVLVTRATSVVVSVLAVVAVCLALKLVFANRHWWLSGLALAAMPAWFLHSRTAFETTMMVAFYACFLCCYLLYRVRSPWYIVPALLFGGATFYSYTNGQGVMLVSGGLLLLSDARYHLRLPRHVQVLAVALAALVAAPYLRFRLLVPDALVSHLRTVDSYWFYDITLGEKLARFGANYLRGISPLYWFLPNDADLIRHRMGALAHLPLFMLPFTLLGIGVCLARWRSSAHRTVLIALAAAPFSAAVAEIFVTRALALVVPAALLFVIGVSHLARWLRHPFAVRAITLGVGGVLAAYSLWLPYTALRDGPTWFTNYGLYGMQYGAPQLFEAIEEILDTTPNADIRVSPNWANNATVFPRFFLTPEQQRHVRLEGLAGYLLNRRELSPAALFVLIPEEYEEARNDPKLAVSAPERVLPYPDGRPGFYFVRLAYAPDADRLFAEERIERQRPQEESLTLDGQPVAVTISRLDIGRPVDLFDGDAWTLVRSLEANPLVVELRFPQPRSVGAIGATVSTMDFTLAVTVTGPNGETHAFSQTYEAMPADPTVGMVLPGGPYDAATVRISLTKLHDSDPHVHVRELMLR